MSPAPTALDQAIGAPPKSALAQALSPPSGPQVTQPEPDASDNSGQFSDPPPRVDDYNTPLDEGKEAQFQKWLSKAGMAKDLENYDLRGFWKSNGTAAPNGHLTDEYKKPNHPTFSEESIYSGPATTGGKWIDLGKGKWRFEASAHNLKNMTPRQLRNYFKLKEPDSELVLSSE